MVPQSASDVLLLPLTILFFGVVVYALAYGKGISARTMPRFRWIGVGLMTLALFLGFQTFWGTMDPVYRASLPGKRVIYSHYLVFGAPLFCVLTVGVLEFIYRRKTKEWE